MKNRLRKCKFYTATTAVLLVLGLSVFNMPAYSQEQSAFDVWLAELRNEAVAKGFSQDVINLAFSEIAEPVARIVTNDRNQAEVVQTYADYLDARVTEWRQRNGKARMAEHRDLLNEVAAEYGVQSQFIVSIWGVETNFGTFPLTEPLFSSLATLAYDKRRSELYRAQFFAALTMLDSGFPPYNKMKSSWAGAVGQSQFIPESYLRYAVDFDKDGKRDIWDTNADVFASIANYFAQLGWSRDETWGRKVRLPTGQEDVLVTNQTGGLAPDKNCARYKTLGVWRDIQDWQQLGLRADDGSDLPGSSIPAALIVADPGDDKGYLVYCNFCTIMRFNPAFKYALSIGLMADLVDEN